MADTYELDPAVRVEEILNGDDIEPANRLEYFLKKAATEVPKPTSADAGKVITVNEDGDGYELAEGGGGGGAFPVELLIEDGNARSSKTSLEIISAFNSGLLPYLFYDIGGDAPIVIYPFVTIDNNLAHFRLISAGYSNGTITELASEEYIIYPNGSVSSVISTKTF